MIEIQQLNIQFLSEIIFDDFNLSLNKGEKLAIVGPSGVGKSTLLNVLAGFIPDFTGLVTVNQIPLNTENIQEIRKFIAWLPQELTFKFSTVKDFLLAPFEFAQNKYNRPSRKDILDLFAQFNLSQGLLTKDFKVISGGQKQRIALVSCLLLKKPILLLDEPSSALDFDIKKIVADYLFGRKDLTIIAVTHDQYWTDHSDRRIEL